ncbi:MAG: hypothetical protein JKX76_03460 [Colwellia sp.]|nr:hypothetical protein [Colwellia sp.]
MREGKIERMIEEAIKPLQSKIDKQENELKELRVTVDGLQKSNSALFKRTQGSMMIGSH